MGSTRFPGKPLVDLCGRPMIHWVVEAARSAKIGERVIVATPDREIEAYCRSQDIDVAMTRADHPSGTDRLAEVAISVEAEIYVNVQGDEPMMRPETIRQCALPLLEDANVAMGSVYSHCTEDEVESPAVVKVVTDLEGNALYFSRYPIPFPRNARSGPTKKHIGIYAYRRETLLAFADWSVTPLEETESLEQLRFLEHGVKIRMTEGKGSEMAVDTPEQATEVCRILEARQRFLES
jgi:3-deoxy-manno-octulosonate cytidylyltransferase (CMP-KDO synthetase)